MKHAGNALGQDWGTGTQQTRLCLCKSSGTGRAQGDFPYFYKESGVGEPGSGLQRDLGPNEDIPP